MQTQIVLNGSSNDASTHKTYSTVRFAISIVIILVSFAGNTLVVHAIYRYRRLRTCANLIILNLSVADVLFTLIVIPIDAYYWSQYKEFFATSACFITGVSAYLFCLVSIYTLVFVSIERYMATNFPLKHRHVFTTKLVQIGVSVIWIWSGVLCALPFALSRYMYVEKYFHCMVDWSANGTCTIIFFIFAYSLPLLTIIYCNIYIFRAARNGQRSRRSRHSISRNDETSKHNLRFLREYKVSLFIVVIVATFIICWTPYAIGGLVLFVDRHNLPRRFMSAAVLLTVANPSFNPIVYGVMNKNFRDAFKNIFCSRNFRVRSS